MAGSSADICRERGWMAGDVLEGDEGYGPERIRLAAIGEERVLARLLPRDGEADDQAGGIESVWDLSRREWRRVEPAKAPSKPIRCKCGKPIRKGQAVVMTTFARYEGGHAFTPWLGAVAHLRDGCTALTPEVIREARKDGRLPVQQRGGEHA
jgi:hypothetical protein